MQKREYSTEIGGKKLTATFSDLAEKANGSVMLKYGETIVLATAVMARHKREGADFFPLTVDCEERFYASGQIIGSQFTRRENRPGEDVILVSRVIDRTIRPLFDWRMRNEVQVVVTPISVDGENDFDIPAVIAASIALTTSNIPWKGPVGAVRIGQGKDGNLLVNPSYAERKESLLDLTICGKENKINMIECESKEISEETTQKAFDLALTEIKKLEDFQKMLIEKEGKVKTDVEFDPEPEGLPALFTKEIEPKFHDAVMAGEPGSKKMNELKDVWMKLAKGTFGDDDVNVAAADNYFEVKVDELIHSEAIKNNRRPDGREMTELRPLFAEAGGISNIVHGTGTFYRGGTHVLSVLTLGGPKESLIVQGMEGPETRKYFMHHYNFPPYSSGEVGRLGQNRRMTGHGALAEKALRATLPPHEQFPYTIRVVSECVASNGSTSMGSVCASTLALMDGGVPISAPTAGIAMGLMMHSDNEYKVLTDIQGPEDHHGDMDFKVAGTVNGITAIQMDVKVDGIPAKILVEALHNAQKARIEILDVITKAISAPRTSTKPHAPKLLTLKINPEKIGALIGPGGKVIQKIQNETGAQLDVEQDGTVTITGKGGGAEKAYELANAITREYKIGDTFEGTVTRMFEFGVMVEIGPDTEGMVHISEMAPFRVAKVTDVVQPGEKVPVVVKEVDERGRLNLSIKDRDPEFAKRKGVVPAAPSAYTDGTRNASHGTNNGRPPRRDFRRNTGPGF